MKHDLLVNMHFSLLSTIQETEGFISPANELETFYNDCDIGLAEATAKTLQRHSLKAIGALYSTEGALGVNEDGYDGRRAYIRCQLDNAMPVAAQEAFTALSKVKWITKDLQTSHSPFLSQPRQTAKVISELADEFLTAP